MNLANATTISRIFLIPIIIWIYLSGIEYAYFWSALLFSLASLTDWLDGFLARKLKQSSDFGAFLDPVADKLLVTSILLLLLTIYSAILIAVAIIIFRELLVSALREWMAAKEQRDTVKVAFIGKLKTTVQMLAIITLLYNSPQSPAWIWLCGYWLINLAAVLSVWSMIIYFRNAWRGLFPKAN